MLREIVRENERGGEELGGEKNRGRGGARDREGERWER